MDAETRLNKRIEIATKMTAAFIDGTSSNYNDRKWIIECAIPLSFEIADAIIDTAIGDMTAEIKEGIK